MCNYLRFLNHNLNLRCLNYTEALSVFQIKWDVSASVWQQHCKSFSFSTLAVEIQSNYLLLVSIPVFPSPLPIPLRFIGRYWVIGHKCIFCPFSLVLSHSLALISGKQALKMLNQPNWKLNGIFWLLAGKSVCVVFPCFNIKQTLLLFTCIPSNAEQRSGWKIPYRLWVDGKNEPTFNSIYHLILLYPVNISHNNDSAESLIKQNRHNSSAVLVLADQSQSPAVIIGYC